VNPARAQRPDWLKVRAPSGKRVEEVSGTLARFGLRTVCREARCPNVGSAGGGGGDRDPAGRRLHARVRLLRRDRRGARPARPGRTFARGERGHGPLLAARGRHLRHPRRPSDGGRRTSHPSCAPCGGKRRGPRSNCSFRTSAETSMRCGVSSTPPPTSSPQRGDRPRLYRGSGRVPGTIGPWICSAAPPQCVPPCR